jgi:hypothetical protein
MKAPEKIYLHPDIGDKDFIRPWLKKPFNENSVEYIRTDDFIEKAIKYIGNHFLVPGMDNEINDFVNYMKGE